MVTGWARLEQDIVRRYHAALDLLNDLIIDNGMIVRHD